MARSTELEPVALPAHQYEASYLVGDEESSPTSWQHLPEFIFHTSATALDYAIVRARQSIDASLAVTTQLAARFETARPTQEGAPSQAC
jgi:hypothetical protein